MGGFIKYFDGNRKNMSFLSEDEKIIIKYSKVWKKIFLYDKKYVKAKRNIRI